MDTHIVYAMKEEMGEDFLKIRIKKLYTPKFIGIFGKNKNDDCIERVFNRKQQFNVRRDKGV